MAAEGDPYPTRQGPGLVAAGGAAGATPGSNVYVVLTVTVTDTETVEVRMWENPQGTPFEPIQDVEALRICSS